MSGSLNKVQLIVNVGRDPEIRSTQGGSRIANLTIATSESWKDKQSGERKERTEWHRVVVFNEGLVGVIEKYVKKGSKLYVEGQLQTRKWTDQQGVEKYSTEINLSPFRGTITLLDSPNSGNGNQQNRSSSNAGGGGGQKQSTSQYLDDDIPF